MPAIDPNIRLFKPRIAASNRPWPLFILGPQLLVILLLYVFHIPIPQLIAIMFFILFALLDLILFGIFYFFSRVRSTMRYELSSDTLMLTAGPIHYNVPLSSIRRVYSRDMPRTAASRQRVNSATFIDTPNLALSNVPYKEPGLVKMVAMSNWQDITFIETTGETYGVTPDDKQAFFDALRQAGVPNIQFAPAL